MMKMHKSNSDRKLAERKKYHGLRILWEHIQRSDMDAEEKIETLPKVMPEVFRSEYDSLCWDIEEHAKYLGESMLAATKHGQYRKGDPLKIVEECYSLLCEDMEILEEYHEELLRRCGREV